MFWKSKSSNALLLSDGINRTTKKKLLIHIGMGKTGTTALQHFFGDNRQLLQENGIEYPSYNTVANAHHTYSPHVPTFLPSSWKFQKVKEWAPVVNGSPLSKVLISSELISNTISEKIDSFCNDLQQHFRPKIVIYVRRQDNMIMSAYNQQIKAGTQRVDIHTMLTRQFEKFNLCRRIGPWAEALGKDNVIVIPYERGQFVEGDIRRDFLARVFEIKSFDGYVFRKKNENPRLSASAMEFKRMINNLIPDVSESNKFNDPLFEYSRTHSSETDAVFSESNILPGDIRLQILRRCDEINAEIARTYLGRSDGKLFYDKEPDPDLSARTSEICDDEIDRIVEFLSDYDITLIMTIRSSLEKVRSENLFEVYYDARRLENSVFAVGRR